MFGFQKLQKFLRRRRRHSRTRGWESLNLAHSQAQAGRRFVQAQPILSIATASDELKLSVPTVTSAMRAATLHAEVLRVADMLYDGRAKIPKSR